MSDAPIRRLTKISTPADFRAGRATEESSGQARPVQPETDRDDEIDLLELLSVFWRGKWTVVLCAALALGLGGYYAFQVATPIYSASTTLALQAREQQVVDLESVISGVSTDQSAINTELEVIRSRELVERLIADMDLIADPEFNASLRAPSSWSPGRIYDTGADLAKAYLGLDLPRLPEDPAATNDEIAVEVLENVQDAISVSSSRQSLLITIGVQSADPAKATQMADRLAQIYLDDQIAFKFAATEYAVNWLSKRVSELELELKQKEDAVKDLRAKSELVSLEALEALNIRAKDIRERISSTRLVVAATMDRFDRMAALVEEGNAERIAAELNDPDLNRLLTGVLDEDPVARGAFNQHLAALLERARRDAERDTAQLAALEASYENLEAQIGRQNVDLVQLNQLVREADATRVLYSTFLARLKETSVQIGLQQADSRILSAALPGKLVAPRKSLVLALSLVLGGMLGVGIVLLRHFRTNNFLTAEELEQATGQTVLGEIPKMPIRGRNALLDYLSDKPTSAAVEAVRNLRTSVLMSNMDNPPKLIMSTSSVPGEGKTTIAIALAHNLAGLGKKVLLVEADIRRRTLSQYFKEPSPGSLVSVVAGEVSLAEAVLRDGRLGADVLMGAKASINAADLFSSQRFQDFLDKAREEYDFVVIDTPPVLVVPDARVIGRYADAILFSVKWDHTPKAQVANGLRQLRSVNLRVSGLVLGQIDAALMKRYGYGERYGAYSNYGHGYYDS